MEIPASRFYPVASILAITGFALGQDRPVTFYFAAKVAYVEESGNVLGGSIKVGDRITGHYTYSLAVEDNNDIAEVGDYWHYSGPYGISVQTRKHRFYTNPDSVEFLHELCDGHLAWQFKPHGWDNYLLRSYRNVVSPKVSGAQELHIAWQLDDSTGKALNSPEISASPPVLKDWDSWFGLTLEGEHDFFIRAHVYCVAHTQEEVETAPVPLLRSERHPAPFLSAFSPSRGPMRMRYGFDKPGRIRIFDLLGRPMGRISHDGAGENGIVDWNPMDASGRPLSSGPYILRLESAKGSSAARLSRIR